MPRRLELNWKDNDSPVTWAIPLFIIAAVGIVGLLILYMGLSDALSVWASASWPHVRGTVVSYSVEQRTGKDSDNREKTYLGHRITFGDAGGTIVGRGYLATEMVTVYYSLNDPGNSVLEPGKLATPLWVLGMGVCFAGVGVPSTPMILVRILRWLINGMLGRSQAEA